MNLDASRCVGKERHWDGRSTDGEALGCVEMAARGGDGRELRAVQAGGVAALHQARPPRLPHQLPPAGEGQEGQVDSIYCMQGNMELLPGLYP